MNSVTNKIIRISLIILIIGVVISIVAVSLGGSFTGLPGKNLTNITESYTGIESLEFELNVSSVEVRNGEEFKIEARNISSDTFRSYVENGKWYIKDKTRTKFFSIGNYSPEVIVYLPEEFESNNLRIIVGVGEFNASKIITNTADIKVGVGDFKINNLITDKLNIDCGVGSVDIKGEVKTSGTIKCGVGNVSLDLRGKQTDYNYDLTVGIGEVVLNNINYGGFKNRVIDNNAMRNFKIDGGIGKISLNINE